jgi:hypothetical protein
MLTSQFNEYNLILELAAQIEFLKLVGLKMPAASNAFPPSPSWATHPIA